jgi:hypothetical protein
MEATEVIVCRGHPLVSASHPSTFEVTAEVSLTGSGHCIIGVGADRGAAGLSPAFRDVLCHDEATLDTTLSCGGAGVTVHSAGSATMTLDHPTDLVWRRSGYVCRRTIGICSDRVAATLPRELIDNLRAGREMVVTMTAKRPG